MLNHEIAERLHTAADLLHQQAANPFRVRAYQRAADTVEQLDESAEALVRRLGSGGLVALPGIGHGIAQAIDEMLHSGRWGLLERLRGAHDPVALFASIPGIGPQLAARIHDHLHVDTLEALEEAAHRGELETVPGIGPRRAAAVINTLGAMLAQRRPTRARDPQQPEVGALLDVDHHYRMEATAGTLPTIAPRRFNPAAKAWLPVLHTDRDGRHFTALFSNTERAHRLGRTSDWVVIYYYDDHHREGQHTVVTERTGRLAGLRVVRGRELECQRFYDIPLSPVPRDPQTSRHRRTESNQELPRQVPKTCM